MSDVEKLYRRILAKWCFQFPGRVDKIPLAKALVARKSAPVDLKALLQQASESNF